MLTLSYREDAVAPECSLTEKIIKIIPCQRSPLVSNVRFLTYPKIRGIRDYPGLKSKLVGHFYVENEWNCGTNFLKKQVCGAQNMLTGYGHPTITNKSLGTPSNMGHISNDQLTRTMTITIEFSSIFANIVSWQTIPSKL